MGTITVPACLLHAALIRQGVWIVCAQTGNALYFYHRCCAGHSYRQTSENQHV